MVGVEVRMMVQEITKIEILINFRLWIEKDGVDEQEIMLRPQIIDNGVHLKMFLQDNTSEAV